MRRLIWTDHALSTLDDVADVLAIINPRGQTAAYIRARVQTEFDNGLDSYLGTGGWYVTVYRSPGDPDIWHAHPTLMAYSVKRWLDSRKPLPPVEAL
jgi:hypothetical protein